MTLSYSDILITILILAVVLFSAHRLGQINPVGTGKLAHRLSKVKSTVAAQGQQLTALDDGMKVLAENSSVQARELGAMRIEMAGDRGLMERTWSAVDRIQNYFIEDAFAQRRDDR